MIKVESNSQRPTKRTSAGDLLQPVMRQGFCHIIGYVVVLIKYQNRFDQHHS
jgi:hypothetical protein